MADKNKNTNKSILEEAISDYKKIFDSASKKAEKDVSESLYKKFDKFLMEEINKFNNSKESVKEPVNEGKKNDEPEKVKKVADKNKESVNESDKSVNKKRKINENEEMDMRELSLADIEEAFDSAEGDDEIVVTSDEEPVATIDPEPDVDDLDLEDIENELADMEEAADHMEDNGEVGDPYTKFKKMYEEMGKIVKEMEDSKMHEQYVSEFDAKMTEMYGEGYKDKMDEAMQEQMFEMYKSSKSESTEPVNESEEEKVDEMHQGKFDAAKHNANINPKTISEEENYDEEQGKVPGEQDTGPDEYTNEGEEEDRDDDDVVDETSITHAHNKKVTGPETPQPEYRDFKDKRVRYALQNQNESLQKKIDSLVNENKKLTKKINENKEDKVEMNSILEKYQTNLEKYRGQLQEMAVFNTNLAHVNSILLNEEFALSSNDKRDIINKFKTVDSISESEKVYKSVLNEMVTGKKNINEDIEDKVNDSIDSSSAKRMERIVESTAYSNDHINKIKTLMNYKSKN